MILNNINVPRAIACLPNFDIEVDFIEAWAGSVYEGQIASVTLAEALALPDQPVTLLPVDASPEVWAILLKSFRKFFELDPNEPEAVRMMRVRMERKARKLARHILKTRTLQ